MVKNYGRDIEDANSKDESILSIRLLRIRMSFFKPIRLKMGTGGYYGWSWRDLAKYVEIVVSIGEHEDTTAEHIRIVSRAEGEVRCSGGTRLVLKKAAVSLRESSENLKATTAVWVVAEEDISTGLVTTTWMSMHYNIWCLGLTADLWRIRWCWGEKLILLERNFRRQNLLLYYTSWDAKHVSKDKNSVWSGDASIGLAMRCGAI